MTAFTALFLAVLALGTGLRLWLARRHVRHIVRHRDRVPAPFAPQIDLAAHQKAADYSVAKTSLGMASLGIDALVLLVLTLGGGFEALHTAATSLVGDGLAGGVVFVAAVLVVTSAIELPLNLYRVFGIETRFGFNKMTPAMFFADLARSTALGALFGLPLLLAVLWFMRESGSLWWLWVWGVWTLFQVAALAIYPTFIAPLFNRFSPMEEGDLKRRIEALLTKCGFTSQGLFVMDGSRRSAHGNAYFTGFGRAKRIVFFDTLLARLTPSEIEAVLAHELGHYRMNHVTRRMLWSFATSFAFLGALGMLRDAAWFFDGVGVTAPASDAMALVVFFMVVPVFAFLLRPAMAALSRKHEFEADAYAARQASGRDLVQALVKLYKDNASTLTPDPLHSAFHDSHPPAAQRIARLEQIATAPATAAAHGA
ncbi:MAG: M48 family metallopeptidase [Burkholderiales bacterium]|jgi:STE24 endopeptidase|nr:M48 family metallopeptidase [Burkholderiales bacterium]